MIIVDLWRRLLDTYHELTGTWPSAVRDVGSWITHMVLASLVLLLVLGLGAGLGWVIGVDLAHAWRWPVYLLIVGFYVGREVEQYLLAGDLRWDRLGDILAPALAGLAIVWLF